MGGMQVLEWGAMFPNMSDRSPIATTAAAARQTGGAQSSGWRLHRSARRWHGAPDGDGFACVLPRDSTYRTTEVFDERFGQPCTTRDELGVGPIRGRVYLDHHAKRSAVRRELTLVLSKVMDLHDVGRHRGVLMQRLVACGCSPYDVGCDILYPLHNRNGFNDHSCAAT